MNLKLYIGQVNDTQMLMPCPEDHLAASATVTTVYKTIQGVQ